MEREVVLHLQVSLQYSSLFQKFSFFIHTRIENASSELVNFVAVFSFALNKCTYVRGPPPYCTDAENRPLKLKFTLV